MVGKTTALDVIDINLFVVTELESALSIFFAKVVGFVDLGVFGEFTVGFH